MTFKDKIEILLLRKHCKKTEFAEKIGITYRALANYLAGTRSPKKSIMNKIENELGVTAAFLFDNNQSLVLNSEESFFYNCSKESTDSDKAMDLLNQAKKLFSGNGLVSEDKQALFSCITEIYFNSNGSQ
ncbi:MAG: helix-turn-helix domain-containing protein [Firmicutes bacterium]|nr:helix-turn-helix domain-containing protein [[Eubacterium] siraeum]MCM1487584.1 helix-turn-helix domain-containing protein [Bacillota bacterium]